MKELTDSIEICASAEEIFNAVIKVFSSEDEYRMWNEEHISCRWIKGKPFEKGSILYAEEYLHGKLHKMKFAMINIDKNRCIEYKLLFPVSIICPNGSFKITQNESSCKFTATLTFRLSNILAKLAGNRIKALESHMKKEGEVLKAIVESKI